MMTQSSEETFKFSSRCTSSFVLLIIDFNHVTYSCFSIYFHFKTEIPDVIVYIYLLVWRAGAADNLMRSLIFINVEIINFLSRQ